MFKIWYMILYYLLLRAVRIMQSFIYEKILQENYNYYPDRSFLKGIEENPALVLSNVHSRTSATYTTVYSKLQWFLNLRYCSMGGET